MDKLFKQIIIVLLCFTTGMVNVYAQGRNELSEKEKQEGWKVLFNGKSFDGWKRINGGGWKIENGELLADSLTNGGQSDIITVGQFDNFELSLEFKVFRLTNSGVKYLVKSTYPGHEGEYLGLEYQILDNENFVYPERGELRTLGSLYDLIPADGSHSLLEWNSARIIVHHDKIEHWLNGKKIVEYNRKSEDFKKLVQASKYKNLKDFGENQRGYILLQNEGSPVAFRNIKIKNL